MQHEYSLKCQKNALVSLKRLLESSSELQTDYVPLYERELAKQPVNVSLEENPNYMEFRSRLWELQHPSLAMPMMRDLLLSEGILTLSTAEAAASQDLEDGVIGSSRENMICPITKSIFDHPVKNPRCQHFYSKKAIQQLIRQKVVISRHTAIPCPVPGCKKTVKENELTIDSAFSQRVERYIRMHDQLELSRQRELDTIDLDRSATKPSKTADSIFHVKNESSSLKRTAFQLAEDDQNSADEELLMTVSSASESASQLPSSSSSSRLSPQPRMHRLTRGRI